MSLIRSQPAFVAIKIQISQEIILPKMNMQISFDSQESIKDLSVDEIQTILELCNDEDRIKIGGYLKTLNAALEQELVKQEAAVEQERQTSKILLKACWRKLSKNEKKECALFFKELNNKLSQ